MRILPLTRTLLRLIRKPSRWKYSSKGYCPACDQQSLFVCNMDDKNGNAKLVAPWASGERFKAALVERENHFCCLCHASFRIRSHAEAVVRLLGLVSSGQLIGKLKDNSGFQVYETAAYNIFRSPKLRRFPNYVVSEYYEEAAAGDCALGVRNENLERLTFPDNTFNVVMNSDVLEHVSNLGKALSEVRRVLKPGGFHVFTVPVDQDLPETVERAKMVSGKIHHLLQPIMHGDSIRPEGVLAFRDFGADVLRYVSRDGFAASEFRYSISGQFVTSVYYAQKR